MQCISLRSPAEFLTYIADANLYCYSWSNVCIMHTHITPYEHTHFHWSTGGSNMPPEKVREEEDRH